MTRLVIIGGSDAGISAALRAREVDPGAQVDMLLADRWPNYSICGLPYLFSGEVTRTEDLAHRPLADIERAGINVHLEHTVETVDTDTATITASTRAGTRTFEYDALVIGTGASPQRPPIDGLGLDGVHLLHTIDDALVLADRLASPSTGRAVIVGGGYIGLEMAEALRHRQLDVTLVERLPEVMPTVDAAIGALVRGTLADHGVRVLVGTTVHPIQRDATGLQVQTDAGTLAADVVLVVTGVRPNVDLGLQAGVQLGAGGARCRHTHVDGRRFAGVLGTQVVKVFDLAVAGTGLLATHAQAHGYRPRTVQIVVPDHKRYYPGAVDLTIRLTADQDTGQLLGAQIAGALSGQVAKRIDTFAAALHHRMTVDELNDLDLSYTPPFSAPWDPVQAAAQEWLAD